MVIVALVLAVIGLAALVTAVVTSNEIVAWVCIAASALGVLLLVVDAVRERRSRLVAARAGAGPAESTGVTEVIEPAGDVAFESGDVGTLEETVTAEDHPEEVVHDEPEYDTYSDDEPEYPQSAEQSAVHIVEETDLDVAGAGLDEVENEEADLGPAESDER